MCDIGVRHDGVGGREIGGLQATVSTDDHTARFRRALICAGFWMLLLGARQEVTKKRAKTFPLGTPLALPLFKEGWGERHENSGCIARRQTLRAAGRGSEIVFVEKLVEPGCVAVGKGF